MKHVLTQADALTNTAVMGEADYCSALKPGNLLNVLPLTISMMKIHSANSWQMLGQGMQNMLYFIIYMQIGWLQLL